MDHLDLIRFGTRIPVVFPDRVLEDPNFRISSGNSRTKNDLYRHSVQPSQELTDKSIEVMPHLPQNGFVVMNQTVLL